LCGDLGDVLIDIIDKVQEGTIDSFYTLTGAIAVVEVVLFASIGVELAAESICMVVGKGGLFSRRISDAL